MWQSLLVYNACPQPQTEATVLVSPSLLQIDTFGKWCRCLHNVCYVKLKKRRYLDKCRLSAPAGISDGEFNWILWNWLNSIQTNIHSIRKHGYQSGLRQNVTLSSCSSSSAPSRLSECIRSLVFRDLSKSALTAALWRIHWDIEFFIAQQPQLQIKGSFTYLAHDTVAPGGR